MGCTIESASHEFSTVNSIWYSPGSLIEGENVSEEEQAIENSGAKQQEKSFGSEKQLAPGSAMSQA